MFDRTLFTAYSHCQRVMFLLFLTISLSVSAINAQSIYSSPADQNGWNKDGSEITVIWNTDYFTKAFDDNTVIAGFSSGTGSNIRIEFDTLSNGTAILVGERAENLYADLGITISSRLSNGNVDTAHPMVIFDSSNPTYGVQSGNGDNSNGDCDLGTPAYNCSSNTTDTSDDCSGDYPGESNQNAGQNNCVPLNNVLIIEEHFVDSDGDGRDDSPDDLGSGGIMRFAMDVPMDMNHIGLMDDAEGDIYFTMANGSLDTFEIVRAQDNDTSLLLFNQEKVVEVNVVLGSSGAISSFDATPSNCEITVNCPADITLISLDGNSVSEPNIGSATGSSLCGTVVITDNAPGSNLYPVGNTVVTWTSTDPYGYETTCFQNITVIDRSASLSGKAFEDNNANGVREAGDLDITTLTVDLLDGNDVFIKDTLTDVNGNYNFDLLEPGTYSVRFATPSTYYKTLQDQGGDDTIDSDISTNAGITNPIVLASGEHKPNNDAGYYRLADLGDKVFLDQDFDGIQDLGEIGVQGVTVNLLDENDVQLEQVTTNSQGNYNFTDLTPALYRVEFSVVSNYDFSPINQGGNDDIDSDVNPLDGRTNQIAISSGDFISDVDAGIFAYAALGNFVWIDENADGNQDASEDGVDGLTVRLYVDDNNDGDPDGPAIDSMQTYNHASFGNGYYLFDSLMSGKYMVQFGSLTDFLRTSQYTSSGAMDSNQDELSGMTGTISLSTGQTITSIDAGFFAKASMGNLVWNDLDGDGFQDPAEPGIPNVAIVITDINGDPINNVNSNLVDTVFTDIDGLYFIDSLIPASYQISFIQPETFIPTVADYDDKSTDANDVDYDSDANLIGKSHVFELTSNESDLKIDAGFYQPGSLGNYIWYDADADGYQDPSESGFNNVIISLYLDENMDNTPDFASPIKQVVSANFSGTDGYYLFDSLPSNSYIVEFDIDTLSFSPINTVADSQDSDVNPLTKMTNFITLGPAENNLDVDAGLFEYGQIGDQIWIDEPTGTENAFDVEDSPYVGATVKLFLSTDLLNPIASTTTDGSGNYLFDSLVTGQYVVSVEDVAPYIFVAQDQGTTEIDDNDFDAQGKSHVVVLATGAKDLTIDGGLRLPSVPVELVSFDAVHDATRKVNDLQWETASEFNVNYYEVQFLDEDDEWTELSIVNARNGENSKQKYKFQHPNILGNSSYYYRLKMVDIDGTVMFSRIVNVMTKGELDAVIYPNPASSTLNIRLNVDSDYILELYDVLGRKYRQMNPKGINSWNIDNLPSGNYFIRIQAGNEVIVKKFEKN